MVVGPEPGARSRGFSVSPSSPPGSIPPATTQICIKPPSCGEVPRWPQTAAHGRGLPGAPMCPPGAPGAPRPKACAAQGWKGAGPQPHQAPCHQPVLGWGGGAGAPGKPLRLPHPAVSLCRLPPTQPSEKHQGIPVGTCYRQSPVPGRGWGAGHATWPRKWARPLPRGGRETASGMAPALGAM